MSCCKRKRIDGSEGLVVSGNVLFPDGNATTPGLNFVSDTNTGIYRIGNDNIGISTGGTKRFDISSTATSSTLPFRGPAGSASAPAYSFTADSNSGMYSVTDNTIGFSTNGTLRASMSSSGLISSVPIYVPQGTAAAPSITFTTDTDTGIYKSGTDSIGISTGGTQKVDITPSVLSTTLIISGKLAASNAAPAFSFFGDPDTGFWNNNTDNLTFVTAGTPRITVSTATITCSLPLVLPSYTVATVPSATTAGQMIYVSNDAGTPSKILAYSDGTNWLRTDTSAVLS
jgi:hypothetical protein